MSPDSKISEEAVKAAFALVDNPRRNGNSSWMTAAVSISDYCEGDEDIDQAAARILAAHARALQEDLRVLDSVANEEQAEADEIKDICIKAGISEEWLNGNSYFVPTAKCRAEALAEKAAAWRGIAERLGDALGKAVPFPSRKHEVEEALSELAKLKGQQQ